MPQISQKSSIIATAVKKFVIMTNKKPAKSEGDKTVKSKADRRATKGRPYGK